MRAVVVAVLIGGECGSSEGCDARALQPNACLWTAVSQNWCGATAQASGDTDRAHSESALTAGGFLALPVLLRGLTECSLGLACLAGLAVVSAARIAVPDDSK